MVSEKTIHELIEKNSDVSVTITLPTHRKGEESKQDPIRFKNLLTKATEKITDINPENGFADNLLNEAKLLLEKPLFWSHVDRGLAIYISEDRFDVYKLPYEVEEQVFVNNHFMITPLLPMTSMDGAFSVLAVSRQKIRLLLCTRNEVEDITPANIPLSVEDYLEIDPEKQLQFHSGSRGQRAVYFGHGANEEDKLIILESFYREIEKEITKVLKQNNYPLVLTGLNENIGVYRKVNSYNRTLDEIVKRNPDELKDKELKDRGWELIQTYFLGDMYKSLKNLKKLTNDKVSNNLGEIVEATVMGKAQTIFISKGEKKWGFYDEENHTVQYSNNPNGNDVELLNWLSITAFKTGSKVYMLPKEEMPIRSTVAAEYRF
ncbi:MAG: hypothetical protein EA391_02370 [Balneolaceae bacterium]|nr:MAG: hypothetical protein EA391_02370 [Balneolaceae bacterium]